MPISPDQIALVADALRAALGLHVPNKTFTLEASRVTKSLDNQPCESTTVLTASALSVAAVPNGRSYRDSGRRYELRLDEGSGAAFVRAIGANGVASAWTSLAHAVSYHTARAGVVMPAPPFDMVAAGAGRVVAKVRRRSQFFFTFLDPMFKTSDGTAVPSTYFKLDPQVGQANARAADLLAHLPVQSGEARVHPAAIRFPAFRALLETGVAKLMVVNQDTRPRTWHELDFRPPDDGADPPKTGDAPPRAHLVTYQRPDGSESDKLGYQMHRVLGLGVGHEHWHEQTSPIYGGEMDSLAGPGLPPVLMERDVYRFFNGPVTDQGGFIDGTGNYYVLAQVVKDQELVSGPRPDAYAVLWADEQAVFSERWRLVHPSDSEFGAFREVVPSALVQYLARTPWYHSLAFDQRKFWCPCRAMHVGPHSRMAVQRQVVILSGYDPKLRAHRFYSINWSFGTADRTWRWRALPPLPGLQLPAPAAVADARPPYESFGLREDMTLYVVHVHGSARRVWFQRYLPADQSHLPNGSALMLPKSQRRQRPSTAQETTQLIQAMVTRTESAPVPNGPMPSVGYAHPWHSLPEDTWLELHRRFSHMGCLMPVVDWRCQYYRLDDASAAGIPAGEPLDELSGALSINTPTLNWDELNKVLTDATFRDQIDALQAWFERLKKDHRVLIDLLARLEQQVAEASDAVRDAEQALKTAVRSALRTMNNKREAVRDAVHEVVMDQVMSPIREAWPYTALSSDDRRAVRAVARSFVDGVLDAVAFTSLWSRVEQVAAANDAAVEAVVAELRAMLPGSQLASRVREALIGRVETALNAALTNGASLAPRISVAVTLPVVGRVEHTFEVPAVRLVIAPLRRAVSDAIDAMTLFIGLSSRVATQLEALLEQLASQGRLIAELLAARTRHTAERSTESAYLALVALIERLKRNAPFVRAERRTPLFSERFTLMALHRPPLGTILVHWDKRDDDLQPFSPFGATPAASLELALRSRPPAARSARATSRSWHACPAPPCVPQATVDVEDNPEDRTSKRLVIAFRSPHGGDKLAENVWRVWLAALPRDASGQFGAAPEVLCQLVRHESFKPVAGAQGWHRCTIDLPPALPLRAKVEQYCSTAGRDRYGTSLWFENVVGQPAPPDQLVFDV